MVTLLIILVGNSFSEDMKLDKPSLSYGKIETKPKSFSVNINPYKDSWVSNNLYENEKTVMFLMSYQVSKENVHLVLYDLMKSNMVFDSIINESDSLEVQISRLLKAYRLNKMSPLSYEYESGKGKYYKLFNKKFFTFLSNKCGTPLDAHFQVVLNGDILSDQAILNKNEYLFSSNEECTNMNFKNNILVKGRSLGIGSIWRISKSLYAVSFFKYPGVFFLDKNLTFANKYNDLNGLLVVNYKHIKKAMDKVYQNKKSRPLDEVVSEVFYSVEER